MLPSASMYLQIVAPASVTNASATTAPRIGARRRQALPNGGSRRVIRPSVTKRAGASNARAGRAAARAKAGCADANPARVRSEAVVHLVLDRMRRHPEASDLLHLELDVRVEHVVGEDAAAGKELAVAGKAVERLVERRARMRHLGGFLRLEIVEILVHRIARMDLVLHAVKSRHQHRGKREVRIARRIREAHLDAAALRTADIG